MLLHVPQPPIIFHKLREDASMPRYSTPGSSGMDICSVDAHTIPARESLVVGTGLTISRFDPKYELQVRPRSGLAAKHGITVLNSPGTIDSDYVGFTSDFEIRVILINHSDKSFEIKPGDRIAQLVMAEVVKLITALDTASERSGGFGSTGV